MEIGLIGGTLTLIILLLIAPYIFLLIMTGWLAEQRGRSVLGWILVALFIITPVLAIPCLFFLGDTDTKRRQRIIKDKEYLKYYLD